MQKTDVIIPVYQPGAELIELIEKLEHQSVPVHRILLYNTEEKYWAEFLKKNAAWKQYENISLHHIPKEEFDHAGTRRRALWESDAEIFVMMTQDALPADEFLLERLIESFAEKDVAVSYARQLPRDDAGAVERFTREFNYPKKSRIKSKDDLGKLGIKTFFCSNVCSAYRRDIYERLGGFPARAIFNEDMIYAAGCIHAGYRIAYAADAQVIHSHNYTNREQFQRNFDLGVSQAKHPEVFENVPSESEGIKLVKKTAAYLFRAGKPHLILPMCITSAYKFLGYKLGKNYKRLSFGRIMKYTMNKEFWRQDEKIKHE